MIVSRKNPSWRSKSWEEAAQTCWEEGRWLWYPRDGMGHEGKRFGGLFYPAVLGVPEISHSQNKAWSRHGALCMPHIPWDPPGTQGHPWNGLGGLCSP